jgi:hypothetical protein
MVQTNHVSFQEAIETVEGLTLEEQEMLIEIIRLRLVEERRKELVADVKEARQAYKTGDVRRGSVSDLMKEIDE